MPRSARFSVLGCPPLPSTLFPYTTLFRSLVERVTVAGRQRRQSQGCLATSPQLRRNVVGGWHDGCVDVVRILEDRKSTRLNSSHPSISYAVFCLKKKSTTFFKLWTA